MPYASLASELAELDAHGLRRERKVLDSAQSAHVTVDGREYTSFRSNDYLGLASHPSLIEAARASATLFGVGAGASHLVLGHSRIIEILNTFFHESRMYLPRRCRKRSLMQYFTRTSPFPCN